MCNPPCRNGGTCTSPGKCTCPVQFSGYRCSTGKSIFAWGYLSVRITGILSPSLQSCVRICIIVATPLCSRLCPCHSRVFTIRHCRHPCVFTPISMSSHLCYLCSRLCHCTCVKCVRGAFSQLKQMSSRLSVHCFHSHVFTHRLFT